MSCRECHTHCPTFEKSDTRWLWLSKHTTSAIPTALHAVASKSALPFFRPQPLIPGES